MPADASAALCINGEREFATDDRRDRGFAPRRPVTLHRMPVSRPTHLYLRSRRLRWSCPHPRGSVERLPQRADFGTCCPCRQKEFSFAVADDIRHACPERCYCNCPRTNHTWTHTRAVDY